MCQEGYHYENKKHKYDPFADCVDDNSIIARAGDTGGTGFGYCQ